MRTDTVAIRAEMVASVLQIDVAVGDRIEEGQQVCLLESMKMEIPVLADDAGTVTAIKVVSGDVVQEGDELLTLSV
ncbi:MAG: biotin/lipoyl-binding carrier protein [Myxococcaceae bacterium]|nr:MAG: biotin/lipoyl-binding carrier protein [Myxococcaceae bacterium]